MDSLTKVGEQKLDHSPATMDLGGDGAMPLNKEENIFTLAFYT